MCVYTRAETCAIVERVPLVETGARWLAVWRKSLLTTSANGWKIVALLRMCYKFLGVDLILLRELMRGI